MQIPLLLSILYIFFYYNLRVHIFFFFFFNDPAPPEFYPLSLPDALPISQLAPGRVPRGGRPGHGPVSQPRRAQEGLRRAAGGDLPPQGPRQAAGGGDAARAGDVGR